MPEALEEPREAFASYVLAPWGFAESSGRVRGVYRIQVVTLRDLVCISVLCLGGQEASHP